MADRPTKEFIEATQQHLMEVWARAHVNWEETDAFLEGTNALWSKRVMDDDPDRQSYHPGLPKGIIDHAVATQFSFDPVVERQPVGKSEEAKQAADRVENGLKAVLDDCQLQESVLAFRRVPKNLVAYGYTSMELAYSFPKGRPVTVNPFRVRAGNPAWVLLDPVERYPTLALKQVKRYAKDVAAVTRQKKRYFGESRQVFDAKENPWELIEVRELWTPEWHTFYAGRIGERGDVYYTERNIGGFVPYAHAFAGFGMAPTDLEKQDPSHEAVGIMDAVKDTLRVLAQSLTGRHLNQMTASFGQKMTYPPNLKPEELAEQLRGGLVPEGLRWMEIPQYPQWMDGTIQEYLRSIEMATFSMVLAGFRPEGVVTVGQQALLMQAATATFAEVGIQINFLATAISRYILQMVDKMQEEVTIKGHTLSPRDIGGNYDVDVTFKVVNQVMREQELAREMQEVQVGLQSQEGYWRTKGVQDTTALRVQLDFDAYYRLPEVQRLAMKAIARGEQDKLMLEEMEKTEEGQRQAVLQSQAVIGTGGSLGSDGQGGPLPPPVVGAGG